MTIKNLWIGGLVIAILIAGYVMFSSSSTEQSVGTASATGTTFNNSKLAMTNMALSTAAGTSTSLLNSDASDRLVTDAYYDCNTVGTSQTFSTGAGLAALSFSMSTSSLSANNAGTNTNYILNTTVATSSTELYVASSTPGLTTSAPFRRWATGSYLIISANATNTAACTIGVKYLAT